MKVHIVCRMFTCDRILPRKARILSQGTGWSLSDRPRADVDLNYYFGYIEYAELFSDWRSTLLAAYFTHLEVGAPFKALFWEQAEEGVDIRVCSADKYLETLPEPKFKAHPPIDPIFGIRERDGRTDRSSLQTRIGVAGFVERWGRKGEKMVERLARELAGKAEVVASGAGWPVKIVNETYAGLPGFYNSLNLFVCTSLYEGCPMTVLEALKCGIPVVIPTHVGLLDELPEMAGIYRYAVGDYDQLYKATNDALTDALACVTTNGVTTNREALTEAVKDYTPLRWCQDHESGLEQLLNGKPGEEGRPVGSAPTRIGEVDRHGRRGVLYVAYGKPSRDCAKNAVKSFKSFIPDIPVAVVSDQPLGVCDAYIQHPDIDIGGRDPKTQIYDLAPNDWEYVMYLDADTEVIAPTYFLWQLLEDGWDMVICRNPVKYHVARMMVRPDNNDECQETFRQIGSDEVMQLNGGVFAFARNPRTEAFFHAWHAEWKIYGKRDQGALLRALWKHPVKLYVLGNEWNNITRYPLPGPTPAAFVNHFPMTARRWRGVVHYRSDSQEAWKAVKEFEKQGGA